MYVVNPSKAVQGFTLVELMIVIVIVGILATIAYPSYKNYLLHSHRTDAMSALAKDETILERCYAQNFSYNGTCEALPAYPHNSPQGYYSISLSNHSASTYTLTATAIGTQAGDTTCTTFTVTQANVKSASDNNGTLQTACWTI